MHYSFPSLTNLDEIFPAIAGRDEFVIKRDLVSGVAIVNYVFTTPTTFEDPNLFSDLEARLVKLRRECRGVTFHLDNGEIAVRKFAKFQNVNECEQYSSHRINWNMPHVILEKLDGSMASEFIRRDGTREWHTKMGLTDVAMKMNDFTLSSSVAYRRFNDVLSDRGYSCLYEFVSRRQRIVVDYAVENLILTACRHLVNGSYMPYWEMVDLARQHGVPVVKALDVSVTDVQKFLLDTKALQGTEGHIVRFEDGSMCKVKGDWYCMIHRTHDACSREKDLWGLVLNDMIDDAKPTMNPDLLTAVESFSAEMFDGIAASAKRLSDAVEVGRAATGGDKKRFALDHTKNLRHAFDSHLMFRIWDGHNPVEAVKATLRKNVSSQTKVDEIRALAGGVDWSQHYRSNPSEAE